MIYLAPTKSHSSKIIKQWRSINAHERCCVADHRKEERSICKDYYRLILDDYKKSLGMKSDDELIRYFIDNLEVLGRQSIDQQAPILTSSILSPEVPPNSDNWFSTPVSEATVLLQQDHYKL